MSWPATYPFAADVLHFYRHVATLAEGTVLVLARIVRRRSGRVVPDVSRFSFSNRERARLSRSRSPRGSGRHRTRIDRANCLRSSGHRPPLEAVPEALLAWLFLQPYAEHLAARQGDIADGAGSFFCPFCSRKPVVARTAAGRRRRQAFALCSMCATEWPIGRIVCPACGEENVDQLAVYTAEQFAYVRVDACDTCGCYLKTVDLTKNGRAVPIVDELATIPLNLWAQEHGYVKVHANMLGI